MPTPGNVILGPGLLYVAPVATVEPISASAVLDVGFVEVGYTEDGSVFSWTTNTAPIEVEESFDPLFYRTTGRTGTVAFQMAEITRRNLILAINSGAAGANSAAAVEPPDPGSELRVKMVWTSDLQGTSLTASRIIYRQVFQGGDMSLNRQKSPDKTTMAVSFNLEKPAGATPPWKVFPNADGLV